MFPIADTPDAASPTDTATGEQICGGRHSTTALFHQCVTAVPENLSSTPTLDTGAPGTMGNCTAVIEQGDPDNTELCVIAVREIALGNTLVIGARPLLLASATTLTIAGVLTVASTNGDPAGAGANPGSCANMLAGSSAASTDGAGGAAGGSFATSGGNGGIGFGGHPGGFALLESSPLTVIRGGCPGGSGGTNAPGGSGGNGGGAIYLLATTSIAIENRVDASGGGGFAGQVGADNGGGGGGGGGGSGGLIALDAPEITVAETARLIANGGGGGAGGPNNMGLVGMNGGDPNPTAYPFVASGGKVTGAGNGGDGANAEVLTGFRLDGNGNTNGTPGGAGGGGGGGLGYIFIFGMLTNPSVTSSPVLSF